MKSSNLTLAALRATPLIFTQRHKAAKNKNSDFNLMTYLNITINESANSLQIRELALLHI